MTTPNKSESSFVHHFADWLHGLHTSWVDRFASIEARLAKVEAALAKDAPAVEQDAKATETVGAEDIREAGTVVADAEKAAGGQ